MDRKIIIRVKIPGIWPIERPELTIRLISFQSDKFCAPVLRSWEPVDIIKAVESGFQFLLDKEDVAPVVHGRWVDNGIEGSMLSGCSVCGFSCGAYSFRYCPKCGARMDGKDDSSC